jgi:hypothetical protein
MQEIRCIWIPLGQSSWKQSSAGKLGAGKLAGSTWPGRWRLLLHKVRRFAPAVASFAIGYDSAYDVSRSKRDRVLSGRPGENRQ